EVADLLERGLAHLQQPATIPAPEVAGCESLSPPTRVFDLEPIQAKPDPRRSRRWTLVAASLVLLCAGLGASEAMGLTQVADMVATVLRIKTPEGMLVVNCGDPGVKVELDGKDVVIAGTGFHEIRLRAGTHRLAVMKDGQLVRNELVTVRRGG